MTTVTLRIPDEKHARLDEAATVMLAELDAETRFKTRAARGSASDGLSLLDKALQAV